MTVRAVSGCGSGNADAQSVNSVEENHTASQVCQAISPGEMGNPGPVLPTEDEARREDKDNAREENEQANPERTCYGAGETSTVLLLHLWEHSLASNRLNVKERRKGATTRISAPKVGKVDKLG